MKILYTGSCRVGSLTEARRLALLSLGHEVVTVDRSIYLDSGPAWLRKVKLHLHLGPGMAEYNSILCEKVNAFNPDLIYIDHGLSLWPETIRQLAKHSARLVHFTSEYFKVNEYTYRHFYKVVDQFDAHVITNSLVIPKLREMKARKIILSEFAYDPLLHLPPVWKPGEEKQYSNDVIFIGHWEPATEKIIAHLRGEGIHVCVRGPGWHKAKRLEDRMSIRPVFGEDYVKLIAGAKIGLGILSKWNKNQSMSRTFEIPAIGSFLLAERTDEHCSYFEEGKEAEYFSSFDEIVEKSKFYLNNELRRKEIAIAGWQRCLRSGYRHEDRMQKILDDIFDEFSEGN